jgi:Flp pilus assembly protein protease CpaA
MRRILRVLWDLVRLPILAVLTVFEPIVRMTISLSIIVGALVTLVFEASAAGQHFSSLTMMIIMAALGVFLVGYYAIVALLSR